MTNNVIVVAGATHREGFIDEYEKSLADAGIDFYLHPLEPLSLGANSITMRRRIEYFREMAQKFIHYQAIYITDAWDVMFFGTKQELLDKAPQTFVVSAERNCYPEASLATIIQGETPWRYANNGMVAASPLYLANWCYAAEELGDLDILDQAWFNRRRAEQSILTPLDITTDLFYVVSAWLEDGALQVQNGRPWNSRTGCFPCFFHFSGKCPTDRFKDLLAGRISEL